LHATLEGVLGEAPQLADPIGYLPDDQQRGADDVERLRASLAPYWELP